MLVSSWIFIVSVIDLLSPSLSLVFSIGSDGFENMSSAKLCIYRLLPFSCSLITLITGSWKLSSHYYHSIEYSDFK